MCIGGENGIQLMLSPHLTFILLPNPLRVGNKIFNNIKPNPRVCNPQHFGFKIP